MTIRIAGEAVGLGDQLFSRRAGAVGTVTQVLDTAVLLRVTRAGGDRILTVTEDGVVAGGKDVYWHVPLDLDLPKSQISKLAKIQAVVDVVKTVV